MPLEPEPTGRRGPWRPVAPGLSASALQSPGSPEWDEMVQNGTETQFFPGPPTSKPVRGMALAPYCPWPLCIRTAICQRSGMGRNGTEWYGNSIFPRPANQQASPGHGHGALLPLASPYPHRNLPAARNGTKWYRMVRKLNFSPAANQQASPGHGHGAPLPMASLHPHCNLLALRNGTEWYRNSIFPRPANQQASPGHGQGIPGQAGLESHRQA